ncbi:MAG: 5'/3'-nucleotidase SurE [Leptolyngbya sp. PLA1]|nr:5'/3'-nucleotidase SurE [Leptolyngbya sp. PLA1]
MRILLTNDDGIRAPGIVAMHDALIDAAIPGLPPHGGPLLDHSPGAVTRAPRSVVFTVAPLTVQSATSHGVTFHEPLMVRHERISERYAGLAVDGRPADCVKLAIANLWPDHFGDGERPDLLISGMNAGANCGINVIYSGTVAAAIEAAFLGVPSIAVSMTLGHGAPRFEVAAHWARQVIERILRAGPLRAHECLSINIPPTDEAHIDRMPDVRVCPMNTHGLVDRYEKRTSPLGGTYYWAAGHGLDFHRTESGSDVDLLRQGCITVTPLQFDLTQKDRLDAWRSRLG